MGEIYLAQDTRLNRKVAIKLLPERYTQDTERLRRFEKEAQAASALNHPNIITIFEIGEAGGRHFIATEFIEGETLRRRMAGTKQTTSEILDMASQVLSALAAAHAAGIVHRDIKPENIMIRPDGYVKVLDFGLAKLTEKPPAAGSGETSQSPPNESEEALETPTTADFILNDELPPTDPLDFSLEPGKSGASGDRFATNPRGAANETVPGVVMGTAQYMSPEQARGMRVDARADIFSFGIVLYEMIARRAPFTGSNSRDIISSILNTDPPPLSFYQADVPEVLEWIVAKALIKDREERYQTTKEALNDLRRLRRRLGIEQEIGKSRSSGSVEVEAPGSTSTQEFDMKTGEIAGARSTGAFSGLFDALALNRLKTPRSAALLLILLAALGFGVYRFLILERQPEPPFQQMQVRRFTTSGKATRAAISPDGKYVVHVLNQAGKQSLLVRQVTESNNIEIVPPAEVLYRGMTFSRDGAHVFYVVQEQNYPTQVLYQVPVLGGVPRRILKDIDSPVTISPDNKRLAFVRRYREQNEHAVIIAGIDGSNERKLASRKGPDFFSGNGPDWSPDGKIIACPAGTNTGGRRLYIAAIDVNDGKEKPISDQTWAGIGRVSWMRDQMGLIFSAAEKGSAVAQIWFLPYPRGAARKITNDLNDYRDMSLTDDSRALVTAQTEAHVNVWLSPGADGVNEARSRRITDGIGQNNGVGGLTWLPGANGAERLVYVSRASGSQDIWLMDQDGKNQKQLTTAETRADRYTAVSPDGRYVVFVSNRTNNSNIYRYDLNTGDQKQLTNGESEEFPAVSADGKWVIYAATGSIKQTLWKVPIDGGASVQLTDKHSTWPDVSPDGQKIACWYRAETGARWQIAIIPGAGGDPEKVFDVPPTADTSIPTRWAPDGRGINFVATRDGVSNIWYQPLDGGAPKQMTNFSSEQILWFDWSTDGKQLACSRGRMLNDVVLISESEQ